MVANPEICRQNGAKSLGPKSERGKAIASRNATKHGILAQKPPLLDTEDLESFQGMIQGLIDEYQPETPTEHMLIQQIAMGWLRLHRLWGVEAATGNIQVLQAKRDRMNVYHPKKVDDSIASIVREHKEKSFKGEIEREKRDIGFIIGNLTHVLAERPMSDHDIARWFFEIQDAVFVSKDCRRPAHADLENTQDDFWELRNSLIEELDAIDNSSPIHELQMKIGQLSPQFLALGLAAEKRLTKIQALEAEIKAIEDAIADAKIANKGLTDSGLFSRYEQHITKQIDRACDRLLKIQEQRKT